MARLLTAGAETQDGVADGLSGTPTVSSTARSGAKSFDLNSNGTVFAFTGVAGRTYFVRAYIYLAGSNPAAQANLMKFVQASNDQYMVTLETNGKLTLRFNAVAIGSASAALNFNQWYRVELSGKIGSGAADDAAELRIDGVTVASETGATRATTAATSMSFGSIGVSCLYDDFAVNDDQGASQNSWPGSGTVVLLVPISDNAQGTGWTNDAASTTNLFNSVANTPPIGIADTSSGTGLNQLRNSTNNASVNYDANLTTYAAAGINPQDTITLVVPVIATGAPVSTSAKQGTVGIVSNPTIANVALGAGGTSGAFWSGTAAGTYSSGWKISFGTVTYAPSVTLGTSPVMRITQVTGNTRIAMVCFMGLYVEYQPAAAASILTSSANRRGIVNQAVNRAGSF